MTIFIRTVILVLAFSGFLLPKGEAQILAPFDSTKASISKEYLLAYPQDIRDGFISPKDWRKKEWLMFSGVALGTVGLFTVDGQIQKWAQEHRSEFSDKLSKNYFEPFGTGDLHVNYTIYAMASTYVLGLLTKNERTKMVAMEATRAWAISSLFIGLSKATFGRHRPFQNNGGEPDPWLWEGPTVKSYGAFVSGHTMASWTVASVFAHEYRDKPIIPIVSYTLATFAGLSRINDDKHWASDVFAGAAFGWALGRMVVNRNNWGVKISPAQQSNGIAVSYAL